MKISVIIPTYKPGPYIWECLGSLKEQTFDKAEFEVILVLNGCKEPYDTQIRAYIDRNLEGLAVNYIQTDRGGVSNARNIALDCARGEYVTFIDDDDYVSPDYLAELYAKALPDTVSLCYPYAFVDGRPEKQVLPYYVTDAYEYCKNKTGRIRLSSKVRIFFSGPCMKLIPMSFIQGRRFDVRFQNGEDTLFMMTISDKCRRFALTSRNAVYYRRFRDESLSQVKREKQAVIRNSWRLFLAFLPYLLRPWRYNFLFCMSHVVGLIKISCRS